MILCNNNIRLPSQAFYHYINYIYDYYHQLHKEGFILINGKIDKNTPIPLYFQLKEIILSEIKNGNYPKNSLIPTENELSEHFEISRTTVRQAITELVQEGWLYRIKSKGTFVSQPKINHDFIQKLESFNDQIKRTGRIPSTEVLEFKVIPTSIEIAEKLNIDTSDKVIYLSRRRYADSEPIVTLKTYLPYDKCAFLLDHNLNKESLYSLLSTKDNLKVHYVKRIVEAVEATSNDLENLEIRRGKPVLAFSTVGFNVYGEPIEFSLARYRGDRTSFEVTVFTEE